MFSKLSPLLGHIPSPTILFFKVTGCPQNFEYYIGYYCFFRQFSGCYYCTTIMIIIFVTAKHHTAPQKNIPCQVFTLLFTATHSPVKEQFLESHRKLSQNIINTTLCMITFQFRLTLFNNTSAG